MLQRLQINNYALIDALDVHFSSSLNIITGETGAGKSILLGALSLLLGSRADTSMLLNKEKKCIVEGEFLIGAYHLQSLFKNWDIDYDNHTIIRREISPEGKSRAFVNDTPVNLNILKDIGKSLIDIHSQHETLTISESAFQLSVLDAFADNKEILSQYKSAYHDYIQLTKKLEELIDIENKSKADQDYFQFQFNELELAALKPGEQDSIEKELEVLTNAAEIRTCLATAYNLLEQSDQSVVSVLNEINRSLSSISAFFSSASDLSDRIKQSLIELKDIAAEAEKLEQAVQMNPQRVEEINERLNTIYSLQQKHRASNLDELLKIQEQISDKLLAITSAGEQIEITKKALEENKKSLTTIANNISGNRKSVVAKIENDIQKMLKSISMPYAQLKIQIHSNPEMFNANGIDKVQFLFSANKGIEFNDLGKVASGGELSRLMLCLKALIAKKISLPTIVFDEIDSGISGEVALKVGEIMEDISQNHQLIAITHLPQLAGRGENHLFVFKETGKTRTSTGIRKLSQNERVVEIAKMIAGENPSELALKHANELLRTNS